MPFRSEEYELQEDTIERKHNAAKIMEILKFIPKTDDQFFNSNIAKLQKQLSSEDCEEEETLKVDDPTNCDKDEDDFSNLLKNKKMSKLETDIFLMSSFTAKHQNIEHELRQRMITNSTIDIPLCAENLENFPLSKLIKNKKTPPKFYDEIHEEMSKIGLDAYLQQKEDEAIEREKAKNKGGKKKERRSQPQQPMPLIRSSAANDQQNNNDNDSMSGIWRMLDGQSVDKGFPITQNGYNVYADKRLNWLTRKDLSFNEREMAKIKCNKWIKKCNL